MGTVKGNLYYIYTCDKSNKKQLFQIGTPQNAPAHQTVKPAILIISAPETPKTPTTNVKIPANKSFNLMGPSGLCIDAHSKIGNRITQVKCASKKTLKWKFISSKGGYIIKNNNGFVMDNSESKKNNKNPIIANKGKNGPNQIWVPELVNANTIIIRNPESNKCMTVKGNLYYIYTCDKSNKKQLFQIGTPQNAPAHQTVKPAVVTPTTQTVKPVVTPTPTTQTVKPVVTPTPTPQTVRPVVTPTPQTVRPVNTPVPRPQTVQEAMKFNDDYEIPFFTASPWKIDIETLRN